MIVDTESSERENSYNNLCRSAGSYIAEQYGEEPK